MSTVNREKRMSAIRRDIAIAAENEQDAYDIIQGLMQEDWSVLIPIAHARSPHRRKYLPCIGCEQVYYAFDGPLCGFCNKCYPKFYCKITAFCTQLKRAREAGLPYTLTLREWHRTIGDFKGKCAYCLEKETDGMEHFIPIALGGGTTKGNCVPGCPSCNGKKRNQHPDKVKHLFSEGTIERVYAYLGQFQEK